MSEWIKVSDALPENDDDILVYNPKDGISTGEFDKDKVSCYKEKDGSLFYSNTGWYTNYSWAPHTSPTHWMPLPQPPEEK